MHAYSAAGIRPLVIFEEYLYHLTLSTPLRCQSSLSLSAYIAVERV